MFCDHFTFYADYTDYIDLLLISYVNYKFLYKSNFLFSLDANNCTPFSFRSSAYMEY